MTTLENWANSVLHRVPVQPEQTIALDQSIFPELPDVLNCGSLIIKRGFHDYDTWRVDYPQWSGSKDAYGALGLATLAVMLLRHDSLRIRLTSRHFKWVTILSPVLFDSDTGIELSPARFHYELSPVDRHPWIERPPAPDELPRFKLTNAEDFVATEEHRAERDCIHGFGSLLGSARFVRLLLDISRPSNQTCEVALECEAGFRGVAPASAEIRLWLPGGDYWQAP